VIKENNNFYMRSDKPHLLQSHCISCVKNKRREYRLENIEKFKLRDVIYHSKNREKINNYLKAWQKNHKKDRLVKDAMRRKTDIHFSLRHKIHNRIITALKRNSKYSCSEQLLDCSISELRKNLESKFTDNMNWLDFLSGKIHIDHIIPCASFDLSKPEEQIKCFNYKNLQPLWAKDNLSKRDKVGEVCYR
jgi:neutral trehalase